MIYAIIMSIPILGAKVMCKLSDLAKFFTVKKYIHKINLKEYGR